METNDDKQPADSKTSQLTLKALPRWKKILVFASIGFIVCGLALIPFDTSPGDLSTQQVSHQSQDGQSPEGRSPTGSGGRIPDGASGLVGEGSTLVPQTGSGTSGSGTSGDGTTGGDGEAAASSGGGDLSPAFLRLGFSFFVGFAVGLAFRSLLRLALIFIGLQLLVLFGLASIEWIQIDTEAMKASYDGITGRIGEQFESFRSFITGSLPQASLGGVGMVAGFKKN